MEFNFKKFVWTLQTNDVDEDNQIIVDAIVKTGRGIFKLTKEQSKTKLGIWHFALFEILLSASALWYDLILEN